MLVVSIAAVIVWIHFRELFHTETVLPVLPDLWIKHFSNISLFLRANQRMVGAGGGGIKCAQPIRAESAMVKLLWIKMPSLNLSRLIVVKMYSFWKTRRTPVGWTHVINFRGAFHALCGTLLTWTGHSFCCDSGLSGAGDLWAQWGVGLSLDRNSWDPQKEKQWAGEEKEWQRVGGGQGSRGPAGFLWSSVKANRLDLGLVFTSPAVWPDHCTHCLYNGANNQLYMFIKVFFLHFFNWNKH